MTTQNELFFKKMEAMTTLMEGMAEQYDRLFDTVSRAEAMLSALQSERTHAFIEDRLRARELAMLAREQRKNFYQSKDENGKSGLKFS